MDGNQNLDGLEGLPLELWMNQMQHQQHLAPAHPSLSTSVYHHPTNVLSMSSYVSPRTLAPSFSAEDALFHTGQTSHLSSAAHQPFSLSSSGGHVPPQQATHERSAWNHLMALDTSMLTMNTTSSASQETMRHMQSRYLPLETHAQTAKHAPSMVLKDSTSHMTFPGENSNLLRMQPSPASSLATTRPPDNYSQASLTDSSHDKMSQHLSQLMSLSKKIANASKLTSPRSSTTLANLSSQESTGRYSPVSPPASDITDLPSSNSGGRVAELLARGPQETSASSHSLFPTSDHTNTYSYLQGRTDPSPFDFSTQGGTVYSNSYPGAKPNVLPSPSEMPLDMSTALGSKAEKSWLEETVSKGFNESNANLHSSTFSTNSERTPLLQTLLSKGQTISTDKTYETKTTLPSTGTKMSPQVPSDAAQDKIIKTVKSTPKKSNFYGRDVSLFAFTSPTTSSSSTQNPEPLIPGDSSQIEEYNSAITFKDNDTVVNKPRNAVTDAKGNDDITHTYHNNTSGVAAVSDETLSAGTASYEAGPHCISSDLIEDIFTVTHSAKSDEPFSHNGKAGTESCEAEADKEDCMIVSGPLISDGQSVPVNTEIKDDKALSGVKHDNQDNGCLVNNTEVVTKEFDEDAGGEQDDDAMSEEVLLLPTKSVKAKAPKRKKGKAAGTPKRQRKKNVGKVAKRKQSNLTTDSLTTALNDDEMAQASNQQDSISNFLPDQQGVESIVTDTQQPTRRGSIKEKDVDSVPRRSSSRKSKDNAMRLIELQADSSYSGIPQADTVVPKRAVRKRPAVKSSSAQSVARELDDLSSDDSTEVESASDKNDGDYVADEDEIETLNNEELLEEQNKNWKKPKDKKLGGLKISIKLSGDSSAEIVSGIEDSPVRKKRKVAKKKVKIKGKGLLGQLSEPSGEKVEDSEAGLDAQNLLGLTGDETTDDISDSLKVKDRHMALMEKYFSSASSATAAKQKGTSSVKTGKVKKNAKNVTGSTKSKVNKGGALKHSPPNNQKTGNHGVKQKGGVKFKKGTVMIQETGDKSTESADIPKFVCGYCPQRYHSKQELLAHMEDHMVEMEEKTSADGEGKEKAGTIVAASQDPRSKNLGTEGEKAVAGDKIKVKPDSNQGKEGSAKQFSGKQKFKCGECGQLFNSKPSLLDHVRIHTADKPFECDICHKCFTERNFLSVHRKTHNQDKLLRCQVCSKAFVHKADLENHMKSHPKRSNSSQGKTAHPPKKPFRKITNERPTNVESPAEKKNKSFASALSGEPDVSGKASDAPAVLVLKRGEISSSDSKDNSISQPKVSAKPGISVGQKTGVTDKSIDNVKKPAESALSNAKVKTEEKNEQPKGNIAMKGSSGENSSETVSSDVCTCKECPECVTRFLQSFD